MKTTIGKCNECGKEYPTDATNIGYFCGATITKKDKDGEEFSSTCRGVVIRHDIIDIVFGDAGNLNS